MLTELSLCDNLALARVDGVKGGDGAMDLAEVLQRAKRERRLIKLAQLSGVGYSYISKLAQGIKPLDRVSVVYRRALEDAARKLFDEED